MSLYKNSKIFFFLSSVRKREYIQGVLLPDRETLRGDTRHEDKHYETGNFGYHTSSVGSRGH